MADIFLSYSRDDQATARRFAAGFEREGFTVWWDQTLRSGEAYDKVTERALEDAKAVVVLWSKASVDSRWVRAEATQAERYHTLMPVMIESCKRPIMFELTHTADLSSWKGDANDKAWLAFAGDVRRFVNAGATGAAPLVPPVAGGASKSMGRKVAIAAVLLLIVGAVLWWLNAGRSVPGPTVAAKATRAVASNAATAAATDVTLAVLPFADMSPAHDQDYFSDGLTEELLNQLANIKGLRVTARTSSFQFKGKSEDVRVIGEKLGVTNILEGSVRKDGKQLRITAQLINSTDGTHLWSQTYDRELSGVFALQEEVAKDVAKALSITLDVGELPRIQGGTTNVEAYDKYLRARQAYHENGPVAGSRAVRDLRDAVALDPQFSRAWLLLSYALRESLIGVPDSQSAATREESRAAAERVLVLAPDAWWAQALRINKFMGQRQWAQAEEAMAAAISSGASPSAYNEATESYTYVLETLGRNGELIRVLRQARDADPLSLYVSGDLQSQLDSGGLYDESQAEYERSRKLSGSHQQPNIFALMRMLARKDPDPAAIKAQFRRLLDEEVLPMSVIHALAVKFEHREQARTAIKQAMDEPGNQDRVHMSVIAMFADRFDQRDMALAALRLVAIDFHYPGALWLPMKTDIRSDPRFKAILRETGLADYFRSSGKWGDFCRPMGTDDFECH
jgi:TolB-like protein